MGTLFNDSNTIGWTTLKKSSQSITIAADSVTVCGRLYTSVCMKEVLEELGAHAPLKPASLTAYQRYNLSTQEERMPSPAAGTLPLTRQEIIRQVQGILTPSSAVIAETGDSWFIGNDLKLPEGATYHVQMQYGSIGWAVGAALGVGLANKGRRQVIAIIGDGSFQMTAQELSTIIRQNLNVTIFLINNATYGIEVALHDGPYNYLKNWDYAKLINIFKNQKSGKVQGFKATTNEELTKAIKLSADAEGPVLVECVIQKDDCSSKLLKWGTQVSIADMVPP